jgi:hypothetical protein
MQCHRARQQVQYYLDHRLSLQQVRDLEAHLTSCPDCHAELLLLEEIARGLETTHVVAEPESMHAQIMQRVSVVSQLPASREYSPWRPSLAEILVAALLATIATIGSILQQPVLRSMLPLANGHDFLSLAFLHGMNFLLSMNSSTLTLSLWITGTLLGICITLALAGTEMRSQWFKAMLDRLPVR